MNVAKRDPERWSHLANHLSEHFSAYCLVGFDMDGERVRLTHHTNAMHWDAIQQALEDVVERTYKMPETVYTEPKPEDRG